MSVRDNAAMVVIASVFPILARDHQWLEVSRRIKFLCSTAAAQTALLYACLTGDLQQPADNDVID